MKISRRGFISLGLGASAGLSMSPLPWKLLDEVSIWTQNWSWVPVPVDGRVSYVDTTCTLCPGNCETTVRKVDERLVSVAGRHSRGICPLGLSGPQLLYTPIRIMSPMLRGQAGFQAISWDRALSILGERLVALRNAGRQDRVAALTDSGFDITQLLFKRFLKVFGSQRSFGVGSADDSWEAATEKLAGSALVPGYDLEAADCILSLGCGLAEGWGNPVRSLAAVSRWKETGASLVQIEPRLSSTAALADQWIACRPGAEANLGFGVCLAMIERHPACRQRLAEGVVNPDEFLKRLRSRHSPKEVENTTGISSSVVTSLADRFAAAKHPLALCGKGDGRTPVPSREIAATLLLNLLAGSINQRGGLHLLERKDHTGLLENGTPRAGFRSEIQFQAALHDEAARPEVLLVAGANPCYTLKGSDRVTAALNKIPLVVSFATHWDETAMQADLVLPMHSQLEGYQDAAVYGGLTRPLLGLSRPVSEKLFDSRHAVDVLSDVARFLGGAMAQAFPWQNYEECLGVVIEDRLPALQSGGHVELPVTGATALPKLELAALSEEQTVLPGDAAQFPLTLVPKTSLRLSSGMIGSTPFMLKTVPDWVLSSKTGVVDINPLTAADQHLAEGETVQLHTPHGRAPVQVHLDEGTMPGLLVMAAGLGHSAFDDYLSGRGASVNRLLEVEVDRLTGCDIAWGARAVLEKV